MLTTLSISNYAIIEHLEINFKSGFTVITGETGAGKSIILGALMLILGERVDAKSINKNSNKSIIEATFDMTKYNLKSYFEENDLDYDPQYAILRRELTANGRSRAFINDSPVSLGQLRALSMRLIDIHSQNKNIELGDNLYQLNVVDCIASNEQLREKYNSVYNQYLIAKNKLDNMRMKVAAAKADEDYTKFQLSQFVSLNLQQGEEQGLEQLRDKLTNVSEIKSHLWSATELFVGEDNSIINALKVANSHLLALSSMLNETNTLSQRLESSLIEIKDISSTIEDLNSTIEDNPQELDRVNERLDEIYTLKKKHNVSTLEELILIQNQLESKINSIDNGEYEINSLEKILAEKENDLKIISNELSQSRKVAALVLETELKKRAMSLGMPHIQCKVDFEETSFSKNGIDKVVFLISFNKNQPLLPISNNASGGEISRIMLCVKSLIASKMQLPTVIFDEIDTGVSGDIANRMGQMMLNISHDMQVVTITHLPQVAALGENHFKVYKKDTKESTITHVIRLTNDERVAEIAGMLGGNSVNEAAINNAKSLLNLTSNN